VGEKDAKRRVSLTSHKRRSGRERDHPQKGKESSLEGRAIQREKVEPQISLTLKRADFSSWERKSVISGLFTLWTSSIPGLGQISIRLRRFTCRKLVQRKGGR